MKRQSIFMLISFILISLCVWLTGCGSQIQEAHTSSNYQASELSESEEVSEAPSEDTSEEPVAEEETEESAEEADVLQDDDTPVSEDSAAPQTEEPVAAQDDATAQTMAEEYPEAYALFQEMYGDFFYIDETGAFMLQWSEERGAKALLPSDRELVVYDSSDLYVELDRIEDDVLYYHYINNTQDEILMYNLTLENRYIDVFADGVWWRVEGDNFAVSAVMYDEIEPGESARSKGLKIFYDYYSILPIEEQDYTPFPPGTYRCVRWLQPYAEAALVLEFQVESSPAETAPVATAQTEEPENAAETDTEEQDSAEADAGNAQESLNDIWNTFWEDQETVSIAHTEDRTALAENFLDQWA